MPGRDHTFDIPCGERDFPLSRLHLKRIASGRLFFGRDQVGNPNRISDNPVPLSLKCESQEELYHPSEALGLVLDVKLIEERQAAKRIDG